MPDELTIDTAAPVMVTGATGYVAGWIVKRLLEAGVTVHAPVRDPTKIDKLKFLNAIAEASPGEIRYFKADLMRKGSYAKAMQGCAVVFHTASPFTVDVKDPQKELIEPAVEGTRNVLATVNATKSVTRVVVTSSCAAIYTDAIDTQKAPGGRITEEVWNTTSSLDYQPYSYSKTLAERAAWEMAEEQDRWKLVTVNPALVLGPAIGGKPTSESFNLMRQAGDGTLKRGAPRVGWGVVDVRDLAQAHLAAGFLPEANGRNITFGHASNMFDTLALLQPRYGGKYQLPKRAAPKWFLWLIGPMIGLPRRAVAGSVDVPWSGDNSKSKRDLGMTYRPLQETVEDMFQYMIDHGYFVRA
jgi:nucleoside-diphosphate-sugar epimerase